ncbi:purine-cytosine permease family protein [Actinomadura rubrisoli]|uniref:Thiamine permease n=1 Tax=Actinomadura rubrisoli TaxID=2530368 RepID=A0A4R5C0K8_9ACTN|nr:thiamine permease [Actinomadura rubrisoli]TDD92235.1 thiamine permease [Actinomadura rubrisoli]
MDRPPDVPSPLEVRYTDDPRVVLHAATEDYTAHVTPLTWRSGRLSLAMAYWAFASAVAYMVTAAALVAAVGTRDTLIGAGLTVVVAGGFSYVLSGYAARTGLSMAMLSRRLFGASGAVLAPLLLCATTVYLYVLEAAIIAAALRHYFGAIDIKIWYLVVVLVNIPLALGGVRRWLDKFSGFLLPFYAAGMVAAVVVAAVKYDVPDSWLTQGASIPQSVSGPGWLYAFSVYTAFWVGSMLAVDFGRFGKPRDQRFNGVVAFGPVLYTIGILFNGLAAIFIVATVPLDGPLSGVSVVIALMGLMGVSGLLLVIVTQVRINTGNLYAASTNLELFGMQAFRVKAQRGWWLAAIGVIAYLLMLTDVLSYLLTALAWQGILIVAWTGLAVAHIALHRGEMPESRPGRLQRFGPGLISWLAASGIGIAMHQEGGGFGRTWAPIFSLVLSFAFYAAATRTPWKVVVDRPHDPRDEVDDIWAARVKCHVCDLSYVAVEMDRDPSVPGLPTICSACASTNSAYLRACRRSPSLVEVRPVPEAG